MRVIVTGAAGFLGSHLCDALLAAEHRVVGVDNLVTGSLDNLGHLHNEDASSFMSRTFASTSTSARSTTSLITCGKWGQVEDYVRKMGAGQDFSRFCRIRRTISGNPFD